MKRIGNKQIVPILMIIVALVFGIVGIVQLGFWDNNGPAPGFFPSIMSVVMFATSFLALLQSFKEEGKSTYNKNEFMVIAAGAGIIVSSFIIGLPGACFVFVILWLKWYENSTWKETLIVLAVVVFIVIGVFQMWLGMQFPLGIFELL